MDKLINAFDNSLSTVERIKLSYEYRKEFMILVDGFHYIRSLTYEIFTGDG